MLGFCGSFHTGNKETEMNEQLRTYHKSFSFHENEPSSPQLQDFALGHLCLSLAFEKGLACVLNKIPPRIRDLIDTVVDAKILEWEQERAREHISQRDLGQTHFVASDTARNAREIVRTQTEVFALWKTPTGFGCALATQFANYTYASTHGGNGMYRYYLLATYGLSVDELAPFLPSLVEQMIRMRLKCTSSDVAVDVMHITEADNKRVREARQALLLKHALDDATIARKRDELFARHGLEHNQVQKDLADTLRARHLDHASHALAEQHMEHLLKDAWNTAIQTEDPIASMIEQTASITRELLFAPNPSSEPSFDSTN